MKSSSEGQTMTPRATAGISLLSYKKILLNSALYLDVSTNRCGSSRYCGKEVTGDLSIL
jgi:hypothetical protein